jgi:hypothetical protein
VWRRVCGVVIREELLSIKGESWALRCRGGGHLILYCSQMSILK